MKAGAFASVVIPAMEVVPKPGRGCPLWASEMLGALNRVSMWRVVTADGTFLREMQHELQDILRFQAYARGCDSLGPEYHSSLVVEVGPGGARLIVPEGWVERVDRHFSNTPCPRCSLLRTPGVVHADDQCDLDLANLVLSA